jgi:hypothetical protein
LEKEKEGLMRLHRKAIVGVCSVALVIGAVTLLSKQECSAEPQLFYSEDWSEGPGYWSVGQSALPGKRSPQRIFVGHPLADYVIYFTGQCGWGVRAASVGNTPLKVSIIAALFGSHRNALSVNLRTTGGALVYKYSFGGNNRIIANCQPPGDQPRATDLEFREGVPYELYSIWYPGQNRFGLGLKNLETGEEKVSGRLWSCRGGTPGWIDIDQEGGFGPAALGRVDVYLGE